MELLELREITEDLFKNSSKFVYVITTASNS